MGSLGGLVLPLLVSVVLYQGLGPLRRQKMVKLRLSLSWFGEAESKVGKYSSLWPS